MIKNKNQLEITLNSISEFKAKRDSIIKSGILTQVKKLELDAINSIIQDLEAQIEKYNKIISREYEYNTIDSFDQLPEYIIGKRIQIDLDESTLAGMLGIDVEYYKWLEENNFYGISDILLQKLLDILDIKNAENILSEENVKNFNIVLNNMKILGITEDFIKQVINIDIKEIKNLIKQKSTNAIYAASRFIYYFKNIFGFNLNEDITDINPLERSFNVAFKKPINIKEANLNITTGYAAYIASLAAKKYETKSKIINADPIDIRSNIIQKYGEVTLESCVDFIWELNIPLLPIDIKGGFHGACFDFDGIRVIVINQQHRLVSRWKFDLLHELYHALTMEQNFYIECSDREQLLNKNEIRASRFANYVIFGSEAETYLQIAVEEAGGDIRFLKSTLPDVAERYNLNIDDFANYAAYRLTMQRINWWGTAKNLQKIINDPYDILLEHFVSNIDIGVYNNFERRVLFSSFLNKEV